MKKVKEDYYMSNKGLMLKAIDNYDVYSEQVRALLRTIMAATNDENIAQISVQNLMEISKISKQGAYNAITALAKYGTIKKIKIPGQRMSFFKVSSDKLEEILRYYNNIKNTKCALKKI